LIGQGIEIPRSPGLPFLQKIMIPFVVIQDLPAIIRF